MNSRKGPIMMPLQNHTPKPEARLGKHGTPILRGRTNPTWQTVRLIPELIF